MKKSALLILVLPILLQFGLYGQEDDLDNLFDAPKQDIVVEQPQIDLRKQFEESKKVKVSADYYAKGLVAAGLTDWNTSAFDASAGLKSSMKVNFDARPAPEFRVFGSVSTTFNPYASLQESGETASASAVWSTPTVDQLYCDYILKDTLFTRLGKFSFAWGQGRFYTPGNLMTASSDSDFNFRLTLPALAGLSFVLLTNDSTYYGDFTYGGKVDFVFGSTMISPAVTYRETDGLKTLLSFKQVIGKTDFLIDFTTNITNSGNLASLYVVSGFYREWEDLKFYGEYQYSRIGTVNDHVAKLAFGVNNPFGAPFNLGLQWEQNFMDWSGTVTAVLTQNIFPFIKMTIGLPFVYGTDGSYAMVNNADPDGRRIALGLALELTGSFQ